MLLWTFQPKSVYTKILQNGEYYYQSGYNSTLEKLDFYKWYDWLVLKMKEKIGNPPIEIKYPVWAWYIHNGRNKKPDLRSERFCMGEKNVEYTCIELEIQEKDVLLSDFDNWNVILNDDFITRSEQEWKFYHKYYENNQTVIEKNRERLFDITPYKNDWTSQGEYVQATFWILKKEMIRSVRHFISA